MKTYLITYSLNNYTKYYAPLSIRIKKFPRWAKLFSRTWIVRSNLPVGRIRTILSEIIEEEGKLLVIEVTNANWAAFDLSESVVEWMKENI